MICNCYLLHSTMACSSHISSWTCTTVMTLLATQPTLQLWVHSQSTMRLATPYLRHPSHCGFSWTLADLSHGSTAGLASRFSFLLASAILTYLSMVGISAHSCDTVLQCGRNDPYTQWHHGCVWHKLLSSENKDRKSVV